ncbi:MAG: hypothetical protein ACOVNU_05180 [Candidatus Kapaibacteriota bacterium]
MDLVVQIKKQFPHFNSVLISEVVVYFVQKEYLKKTELIVKGQFVKTNKLLSKLVKIFILHDSKGRLMYYVKPNERCKLLFSATINDQPVKEMMLLKKVYIFFSSCSQTR